MTRKILLLLTGAILTLAGLGLAAGGVVLLLLTRSAGFVSSGEHPFSSAGYALVSSPGTVRAAGIGGVAPKVRIRARPAGPTALFLGVAPATEVTRYLSGVPYDEVTRIDFGPFRYERLPRDGSGTPAAPGGRPFWLASAAGSGEQTLDFAVPAGDYRVVVMNADAGRGVEVRAVLGVQVPLLHGLGVGFLAGAGALVLLGLLLVGWGVRAPRAAGAGPASVEVGYAGGPPRGLFPPDDDPTSGPPSPPVPR